MFSYRIALAAFIVAILALAAASFAITANSGFSIIGALDGDIDEDDDQNEQDDGEDDDEDDEDDYEDECELDYVVGNVTAWKYGEDEDDMDDDEKNNTMRPEYFIIGNDTYVDFGPWWYWSLGTPNVTSVVRVGDEVNVTGEIMQDGDMTIISAWIIENLTTGEKLTIKGEGAPSWAGGPKAFGIDPWPPC